MKVHEAIWLPMTALNIGNRLLQSKTATKVSLSSDTPQVPSGKGGPGQG